MYLSTSLRNTRKKYHNVRFEYGYMWRRPLFVCLLSSQAKQQLSASVDLLSLHQGQTVGVAYSTDDSVLFFVDERLVCRVDAKLPQACYALVDLYGPCCEVKVQPLHPVLPEALKLVAIANGAQPQPTSSSPLLDQARPISGTPVAARTTVLGKRDSVSTSVVINGRLIDSMAGDLDDSPRSKLPPVAMGAGDGRGTSVCSYRKLCGRFLKSLAIPGQWTWHCRLLPLITLPPFHLVSPSPPPLLPPHTEAYFDRTPQHSKCYCEKCSAARGDPRVKLQGEPHPMKYTVPHGWVKFGLRSVRVGSNPGLIPSPPSSMGERSNPSLIPSPPSSMGARSNSSLVPSPPSSMGRVYKRAA